MSGVENQRGPVREKTIGILGGMGPEATLACFARIIKSTPAKADQEHPRVIINSNPKVPDRIAAVLGEGESPVPALVEGCRALQSAGADFIIIPCVTAHFFLEEIQRHINLAVLSAIDAVTETIIGNHPEIKTVGLMGTVGTIRGGLFQKCLALEGIETIVPDENHQTGVVRAIADIKDSEATRSSEEVTSALTTAAESLVARGAGGIIAGCTEIPLALYQEHLSVPYFDVLTILARTAVLEAGLQPVSLP